VRLPPLPATKSVFEIFFGKDKETPVCFQGVSCQQTGGAAQAGGKFFTVIP